MSENQPIPANNELGLSEEDLDAVSGGGLGGIVGEEGTTIITSTTVIITPDPTPSGPAVS